MFKNKLFFLILISFFLFSHKPILTKSCETSCVTDDKDCVAPKCANTARAFYRTRSVLENATIFLSLNTYNFHRKYFETNCPERSDCYIHLGRGVFYQQSSKKDKERLPKYFFPNKKCKLAIRENGTGDVGSLWLKLIAPDEQVYRSNFTICPERKVIGGYYDLRHDFQCLKGAWLETKFAVYQVNHKLNPSEKLINPNVRGTLPGFATALDFFNSNDLVYGKIHCGNNELSGFDDIEVKFGYDFLRSIDCGYYAGLYGTVIMPISQLPNAEFLFEPLLGRAHWGLGAGFNAGYKVWQRDEHNLTLMTDIAFNYLFRRKELRSLDLKNNGEWSRYLRVATQNQPGISYPAINFTTLPVNVTPRGYLNFWAAAHYQRCNWHVEAGYNLWWKQSEKICLPKCDPCINFDNLNLGIFDIGNTCNPTSASTANISQGKTFTGTGNVVVSDPTFVPLTTKDLDLASVSHPQVLTNTFYAAVSRDTCFWHRLINIGLIGSFEFSRCASALQQWSAIGYVELCF